MRWCDDAVIVALNNWARWARGSAGGPVTRISSLEGRYTPDPLEDEEPVVKNHDPIDEISAVRIEHIVRELEARPKKLIKHYYILRSDPRHVCRRLRITRSTWESEMRSAHWRISLAFLPKQG